ncbi:DUF6340 family protein [Flagellimonas okinawensis]|uniref:DUF6340 family protein n=1 Tax=Flagellimonas okinawensis TaxID=3031324 RepID=A0ABT5XLB1_9FLAO|nr:DUF6340 family protein [[Muricauda] okinawensis]MDF0706675.1 DUF6340 family protein [[Muricauda] okinawensis]
MKNFNLLLISICAISLVSCASSGFVYLDYPQEPELVLPQEIGKIAVVNRSLTKEEDKSNKTLESIATGEIAGSDKLASDEAVKGIFDGLQNSNHLKAVIPPTVRIYGTGTRKMPETLSWDKVNEICESANADVLLVLENFDSNSDFVIANAVNQVTSVLETGRTNTRFPRRARVNVRSFWRLYDPQTKTIMDQYQQTYFMDFDLFSGAAPLSALPETAYAAGMDYTNRFFTSYYRVRRDMYKKGKGRDKNQFAAGWRSSEVANWDNAINMWTQVANNRGKSAGRAAHNVAVAYEVKGETDLALEWAQRAYQEFGDKMARDYAKVLLNRKRLEY